MLFARTQTEIQQSKILLLIIPLNRITVSIMIVLIMIAVIIVCLNELGMADLFILLKKASMNVLHKR